MNNNKKKAYMVSVSLYISNRRKRQIDTFNIFNKACSGRIIDDVRKLRIMKTKIASRIEAYCPMLIVILRKLKVDVILRFLLGVNG